MELFFSPKTKNQTRDGNHRPRRFVVPNIQKLKMKKFINIVFLVHNSVIYNYYVRKEIKTIICNECARIVSVIICFNMLDKEKKIIIRERFDDAC